MSKPKSALVEDDWASKVVGDKGISIEIKLEHVCFNVLILFFSSFEHADYGPQQH